MTYHDHLEAVNEGLAAALGHLADLRQAMAELDAAGMYPAVPTEQWQARNGGEARYLYMLFRKNPDGTYQGPGGKRKVYIGTDPDKQAEAQRLAENRRRWEALDRAARRLEDWIFLQRSQLQTLAERCQEWPTAELLGPVGDVEELDKGPNDGG